METLKRKIQTFEAALATLEKAVSKHKASLSYDEERFEEYRDSLIQRFEYCTDLLWKVVKDYLEKVEGIHVASPKPVFRACYTATILSEEEVEAFLLMLDARNTTSHVYREEFASILYKEIPEYYQKMYLLINKLIQRLK
ncbi:MAG: Nucleotidyltransferase substrate binding protein, HI0074 family [candidate division TM6 bacterium GW2011_GWE2_42_60]|nr:MAG: Nucleotidyltransferase substrate binding protein, HI0074 family [candidate division TM6 bacterium GW2011_GWE2_42_60]HBY05624.1 nucleotidyltransferase [Candidatus Dependentiae bacterium]